MLRRNQLTGGPTLVQLVKFLQVELLISFVFNLFPFNEFSQSIQSIILLSVYTSSRRDSTSIRTALNADLCPNTGFPVFALMTAMLGFTAKAPLG